METIKQKRFNGLDILKLICAFLVVFIHVPIPGFLSKYFVALCRIAVPIFFVITGYFWTNDLKKQKHQIIKIVKLIILTISIYFIKEIIWSLYHGNFTEFIKQSFGIRRFINLFLLNRAYIAYHAWYLYALLYVLIILYFITKKINIQKLFFLIPVLLFSYIVIQFIGCVFPIDGWTYVYLRNYLFTGLPFVLLGKYLSTKKINISRNKNLVLIVLFIILNIIETIIFNVINSYFIPEIFLSGIVLVVLVFNYFLNLNVSEDNILVLTGKKCSMNIYVFHVLVIFIVDQVISIFNDEIINTICTNLLPFIVYLLSILLSLLIDKIKTKRVQN